MRVLIAEDDILLTKLMDTLVRRVSGCEVITATDGEEALVKLGRHAFDLVLLDWEMPGKTGIELLGVIQKLNAPPPVVMVTASSDRARVLKAIQAGAAEYIIKPFDPEYLLEKVERYVTNHARQEKAISLEHRAPGMANIADSGIEENGSLQGVSPDSAKGKIADVLRQIDEISTIPQIVVRFIETSNDPDASMEDLQEIVKCDPAMASRILRLVNSSAFGVRSRITNLQQAIGYLGIKQVRNLVVAISVSNLFRTHGCLENYERIKLWKHMVSVAICSRLIANMSRAPDAEEYFLAGLLHDVGIVLEDQFIHQPFCRLIKSLDEERTLSECEHDWFHFDHAMLGEAVARQWLFPEAVCAAIRHHHQSEAYSGEDALIVRTVELANSVCSQMGITSVGVNLVRDVTPAKLDIPMSAEALRELISQLQEEIHRAAGLIEL